MRSEESRPGMFRVLQAVERTLAFPLSEIEPLGHFVQRNETI